MTFLKVVWFIKAVPIENQKNELFSTQIPLWADFFGSLRSFWI